MVEEAQEVSKIIKTKKIKNEIKSFLIFFIFKNVFNSTTYGLINLNKIILTTSCSSDNIITKEKSKRKKAMNKRMIKAESLVGVHTHTHTHTHN